MLARILFLLMLVMNLASAAWWYSRAQVPVVPWTNSDPGTPSLLLLSEHDVF